MARSPVVLIVLAKVAILLTVAVLLFTLGLYLVQDALIFPASQTMNRDPGDAGWAYDELRLEVMGETTHGWYVPLENHRGVALFSHGNAGNLSGRIESIGLLRSFGLSVLAYDYGGYGHSTGKPSEARINADIGTMWEFLTQEKGIAPNQIILFGRSMGAAPTIDLARRVQAGGVVIESAFLSIPEAAANRPILGWLTFLVRNKLDNKSRVAAITSPKLFFHSPDDEVIPFDHGQRLFELACEPKTFVKIHGGHNLGFVESEDVYRAGWEAFLAPILGPQVRG